MTGKPDSIVEHTCQPAEEPFFRTILMRRLLSDRRRLLFALTLILGSVALRWPVLDRKVWNLDEGSTVTMAGLILHGKIPFRDAADNRTPLVPYLKAAVLAVAGEWNVRAIHFAVALMLGFTAVLLWQIGRRLGREAAGVFAALCFFWLSAGFIPLSESLTAHTGWFLVFFSTLGFWIFVGALRGRSSWGALAAGVAFGLSYLSKQPGLLDFGVGVVLVILAAVNGDAPRAWPLLPLILGFLLPIAGTMAYFAAHGAFGDLIFYSWSYNTLYYVPEAPESQRHLGVLVPFELLRDRVPAALGLVVLAWPGAFLSAMRALFRRQPLGTFEWLLLGWSASGILSSALSGRGFSHYSIQFVPGLSLACGWILAAAGTRAAAWWREGRRLPSALLSSTIGAIFLSFAIPVVYWIHAIEKKDDTSNPLVGGLMQEWSRPDERIFVWGYMPEMHVFARRLPNTRFFYTNWATGLMPWTNVDWFRDTTYAIIPGTPEQLRADFERHPPALVFDTGRMRAYLKYPLRKQAWLWRKVVRDFAEVEPEEVGGWGFKLYRRLDAAPLGRAFPAQTPIDPRVTLRAEAPNGPADTSVTVGYPAGTTGIELYRDGQLYRRLSCPTGRKGTVIFQVAEEDLPLGQHTLQAVAVGGEARASIRLPLPVDPARPIPANGPPLEFDGRSYAPLSSFNGNGAVPAAQYGAWNADAPAEFVYERPPGVFVVEIDYAMADTLGQEPERWWTDGIEFAVQFENRLGQKNFLLRRHLDPRIHPEDRGLQTARVPVNEPGRIHVWFSPGGVSDSSADWASIKAVRGSSVPLSVQFRGQPVRPTEVRTPLGLAPFTVENAPVLMIHAPSQIELPLLPGMYRLNGLYGMMDSSWSGPKGTAGTVFEVWHVPPQGEPHHLASMTLDPVRNPKHRGPQRFSIVLPQGAAGKIRLLTYAAPGTLNDFNYTYWGQLEFQEFSTTLASPDGAVRNIGSDAQFGFAQVDEAGREVIFAHPPARLDFQLPRPYARLRGEIGLIAAAYAGSDRSSGARFVIDYEGPDGHRTVLWQRELDPQNVAADRGFVPFTVDLPADAQRARISLRTEARTGMPLTRAWAFWHNLHLER